MTLDEYMKDKEGVVAIGAASGYFFIGTREEYEESIDKIQKKAISQAKEVLHDANSRLEALKAGGFDPVSVSIYIPETTDPEIMRGVLAGWKADADKLERNARCLYKFIDKYENAIKSKARAEGIINAIPYRERQIKETYPSITEDKTNVIVEGDESARFWDKEEFDNDRAKNTKHYAQG